MSEHRAIREHGASRPGDEQRDDPGRPLWQIVLAILVLGFVARRVAVAAAIGLEGGVQSTLVAAVALQAAAGLAVAFGLWMGHRWVVPATLVLGASVVASAALDGWVLGRVPPVAALGQILVAGLLTGGLALILRYEFGESGTGWRRGA